VPLLHQRVGANEPKFFTTNGYLYTNFVPTSVPASGHQRNVFQWHFFVFNTNQFTNGQELTNLAFTTFEPPDWATQIAPRTNGADLDMYVSTNPRT